MGVIVVGAGIVGAAAAYQLARSGTDVLVVDRDDLGQATAAGAGVIFPWPLPGTDPGWHRLGLGAAEHYPQLIAGLEAEGVGDHGYRRTGGMTVLVDGPMVAQMQQAMLTLRAEPGMSGLGEVEALAPGEPAGLFPVLSPELAGVWVSGLVTLDGRALRDALLRAAVQRGAVRRAGAVRLELSGDGLLGVSVDGDLLGADAVVAAAGAWSAALVEPLGVRLAVSPQRGQIVHLELPGQDTSGWPIVRTLHDHYLLGFPGGRVVAGATREPDAGFDYRVTAAGMQDLLGQALAIAPGLAPATVVETRVGFRPVTPDGLPLIGTLPGLPGLVVATGLGSVGLTFGPYVGALAAQLALGAEVSLDLSAQRPDR